MYLSSSKKATQVCAFFFFLVFFLRRELLYLPSFKYTFIPAPDYKQDAIQ